MIVLEAAISRFLRGAGVSRLLRSFGIDARRYWLLMDLFGELTDRREMFGQLGREGMALKAAAWMYFVFAGLGSVALAFVHPPLAVYFLGFLAITAFILVSVLLSEIGNSLINPVESLVLAHQPVNGATYTAAKLTHLLRILLYFVPGLNAVPALLGLVWKEAGWLYPLAHMAAAFVTGLLVALLCCAVFGWLIGFVPPPRLKTVGQLAEMTPFLAIVLQEYARKALARAQILRWLPAQAAHRAYVGIAIGGVFAAAVVFGIRSLSGDYLIKVSSIVHGGSAAKGKRRKAYIARIVSRLFGGPASRAGFEYVSRMMVRDWQFRRQLIPLIPAVIAPALLVVRGFRTNPFSGGFTAIHAIPHVFGILFFWICTLLPYGSDHKGSWIFLLAPSAAFRGFARGVYAFLWIDIVIIPHAVMLSVLSWFWGIASAGMFIAFSVAVASLYLGLNLRLIEGIPFGKQPETARAPFMMPLMIAGGLAMAIAVALQHFFVFRSPLIVLIATVIVAAAAYLLTRNSLETFAVAIRFNLGLLSAESGSLYKEIDV